MAVIVAGQLGVPLADPEVRGKRQKSRFRTHCGALKDSGKTTLENSDAEKGKLSPHATPMPRGGAACPGRPKTATPSEIRNGT